VTGPGPPVEGESTGFLYPFLEAEERDVGALVGDLTSSASAKAAESARLRSETLQRCSAVLQQLADELASRFLAGRRMFVFGNGGSATDAEGIVALFRAPPAGAALRARSLVASRSVVTALGNDVGFELVFARQLIAHGRAGDIALGVSTSGNSTNLLVAFAEAKRRHLLTIGLAGYDGGQMATCSDVEHCLVVHSDSVHRIQETQGALVHELWRRIQDRLAHLGPATTEVDGWSVADA
jgi:D-sedoheptulose 7-phosphate isomerase